MKAKCVYLLAATIIALTGCEPQVDTSGGSTNNVSPRTETNTVPQVNRPPESAVVTNAIPPQP